MPANDLLSSDIYYLHTILTAWGCPDPKEATWSHLTERRVQNFTCASLRWLIRTVALWLPHRFCSLIPILMILKVIHKQYILVIASMSFSLTVDGCLCIAPVLEFYGLKLSMRGKLLPITSHRVDAIPGKECDWFCWSWGPSYRTVHLAKARSAMNSPAWLKCLSPDLFYVTNGDMHGGSKGG